MKSKPPDDFSGCRMSRVHLVAYGNNDFCLVFVYARYTSHGGIVAHSYRTSKIYIIRQQANEKRCAQHDVIVIVI